MLTRTLLAPAKINLTLSLVGRRADGYHLLDSLVFPVALFDEIDVSFEESASPHTAVTSDAVTAPGGAENLAYRAAEALRPHAKASFAVHIDLRKRIPVGSGLGGGSSDAAAVLKFVNRALGSPLDGPGLIAIAAGIGADVPFFIHARPARVRGVGEAVQPLDGAAEMDIVLCSPNTHLSTAQVFAESDRLRASKPLDSLTRHWQDSNIADFVDGHRPISELLVNDLEDAAARICPEVRTLKRELLSLGAQGASMTGSGSAVFGVCSDTASAERIATALRRKGMWAWPTKTLATSPEVEC